MQPAWSGKRQSCWYPSTVNGTLDFHDQYKEVVRGFFLKLNGAVMGLSCRVLSESTFFLGLGDRCVVLWCLNLSLCVHQVNVENEAYFVGG